MVRVAARARPVGAFSDNHEGGPRSPSVAAVNGWRGFRSERLPR
jgi:hypothetical protein